MPDSDNSLQAEDILSKKVFATGLKSWEIRLFWSKKLKQQSIFSARTTTVEYLERVKELLAEFQNGIGRTDDGQTITQGLGRTRMLMREKLIDLGLVQRDEKGTVVERMTNLGSKMRLNLIIDTNTALARAYQQQMKHQNPYINLMFPCYELVRGESRKVPRNWIERWHQACQKIDYKGVVKNTSRLIAKVDSPIWKELGNMFDDSIGVETPPFCWNSGMRWIEVSRKELKNMGIDIDNV